MAKSTSKHTPDVKLDTGILTIKRGDGTKDEISGREIVIRVNSTIVDRLEGTAHTEVIWGDKPNIRVITNAAAQKDIRDACAEFFLSRKIAGVLNKVIEVRTVRPADVMLTKAELYTAIRASSSDDTAASVIMELVNAYLGKVGIVTTTGKYSKRFVYGFEPVTVTAIANDVATFEIVRVMEQATVVNIANKKYAREVFAQEVADALYEIGRSFLDINSLSSILGDIVRGVRANIDVTAAGLTGSVDKTWRDNDVVDQLASNWVFIDAALSLPSGSDITPSNEGWKLDKFAPGILAALKSSQRYAIVGKAEATRNIGTRKIRDLRGRAVSVVLWRSANPDAVGQSVYAYEDSVLPGAYTLTQMKERIGEVVAQAYNRPADLGTDAAAKMLSSTLLDAVQGGYSDIGLLYQIDLGGYAFIENRTLAALLSERVSVVLNDDGIVTRDTSEAVGFAPKAANGEDEPTEKYVYPIKMWYNVPTTEKDMMWMLSGRFDQSHYMTASVAEVFLAIDELVPSSAIESKPQMYTSAAFNTRIVGFDTESIRSVDIRYPFSVNVNGANVRGSFKPSDLGSLKANSHTALVVPVYNREVFEAVANTFQAMFAIAQELKMASADAERYPEYTGGASLPAFLERRAAKDVLLYSQKLSPAFRAEIHRSMMSRALHGLTMDQSIALRARLAQRAFGAYADVLALSVFIEMQGMYATDRVNAEAPNDSFWRSIVRDEVMAQTYFEVESDRDALSQ